MDLTGLLSTPLKGLEAFVRSARFLTQWRCIRTFERASSLSFIRPTSDENADDLHH